MSVAPRAYHASDLMSLKRNELIKLVMSQHERWPAETRLNSHVNKTQIRNVLLDPQYGFTTTNPPVEQYDAWDLAGNPFAGLLDDLPDPQAPGASVLTHHQDLAQLLHIPLQSDDSGQQRRIHVFIEDGRHVPMQKTSKNIIINVESIFDGNPGQRVWSVSTRDVVLKIQEGHGRLTGPGTVRIGIPDSMDTTFTEYFVEAPLTELANAPMIPAVLVIRDVPDPSLTLRVSEQLSTALNTQVSTNSDPAPTTRRSPRLSADEAKIVTTHLQSAVKSRNGYVSFRHSKNVVLQNPDIPAHWRFVAQFWNDFHKKQCDEVTGDASLAHKYVPAQSIYESLHLGSSAIRQAIEGDHLVQRYAVGDSPYFVPEVMEEILTRREPPRGRDYLLKFLRRWDVEHGNTSSL